VTAATVLVDRWAGVPGGDYRNRAPVAPFTQRGGRSSPRPATEVTWGNSLALLAVV